MKRILIAVPTAKYIESDTFKSIYDLDVPEGYTTEFHPFINDQVDQIRNLIAEWAKNYDYLFAVDSDIVLPKDCLVKMLNHNVDIVSGLYIQRKPGQHLLELYKGGHRMKYQYIRFAPLVEVDSCGFGCVLVNSNVIRAMEYPHFVYKSAIDHNNTLSEDTYFCLKAKEKGFRVFADPSILCKHIGQHTLVVDEKNMNIEQELRELSNQNLMPTGHYEYLRDLNINPPIIYDIGASVLHWTKMAKYIWPTSQYFAFEAMQECEFLYKENNIPYFISVLSDVDGKKVEFYENPLWPGGNSYFKLNKEYEHNNEYYFNDSHKKVKFTMTLDSIVKSNNLPLPDLIKIDVQGAELDILKGAQYTLSNCKHLVVELQSVEYNIDAPLKDESIKYIESLGFKLITGPFYNNGPDGDYYFRKGE